MRATPRRPSSGNQFERETMNVPLFRSAHHSAFHTQGFHEATTLIASLEDLRKYLVQGAPNEGGGPLTFETEGHRHTLFSIARHWHTLSFSQLFIHTFIHSRINILAPSRPPPAGKPARLYNGDSKSGTRSVLGPCMDSKTHLRPYDHPRDGVCPNSRITPVPYTTAQIFYCSGATNAALPTSNGPASCLS